MRFLQLHSLTSYPASLLNRDDAGFAKRIPFGGAVRTRISSQCLKRHWRTADSEHALDRIGGGGRSEMSIRSRRTFERYLFAPLVKEDGLDGEVAEALTHGVLEALLGESKKAKAARKKAEEEGEEADVRTKQVTIFGRPEIRYLRQLALELGREASNAQEARKGIAERLKKDKELKKNLQRLGGGLDAALFGRMTTGDVLARTDAAVHVAHAFTTHAGDFEADYFSAVDDLQEEEEVGSGHINTSELSSGLFYGYVVIDVPLLVSNVEGVERSSWTEADRTLAAEVVRRFVHLLATVSPGAKLGSTAPYAYAHAVLAEAGEAQPRTLANAFLEPVSKNGRGILEGTSRALAQHLRDHDAMYGACWTRKVAAMGQMDEIVAATGGERVSLADLAGWAADRVREE